MCKFCINLQFEIKSIFFDFYLLNNVSAKNIVAFFHVTEIQISPTAPRNSLDNKKVLAFNHKQWQKSDKLQPVAQLHPPPTQLGQPAGPCRVKRGTVIVPDHFRRSVSGENPIKI
jgi:hypothetical protein